LNVSGSDATPSGRLELRGVRDTEHARGVVDLHDGPAQQVVADDHVHRPPGLHLDRVDRQRAQALVHEREPRHPDRRTAHDPGLDGSAGPAGRASRCDREPERFRLAVADAGGGRAGVEHDPQRVRLADTAANIDVVAVELERDLGHAGRRIEDEPGLGGSGAGQEQRGDRDQGDGAHRPHWTRGAGRGLDPNEKPPRDAARGGSLASLAQLAQSSS
jgi:hypothetical protein